MKNFNENGRSMVEMLGVLAIIGVLSAGGLAGYSKAMFKHKLNTTMDQITMLVTNIRTMYGTQKNYNGLDTAKAYSLGIIPAAISTNGTTFTNPFKGAVSITASQAKNGANDTGFTVQYTKLPKEACIALATADFGSGAGSGFVGVWIGNDAEVYIGSGNGTFNEGALVANSATRGEGQAYPMGGNNGAITKCVEQATINWKFY